MGLLNVFTAEFDTRKNALEFFIQVGSYLKFWKKDTPILPGHEPARYLFVTSLGIEQIVSYLAQHGQRGETLKTVHWQRSEKDVSQFLPEYAPYAAGPAMVAVTALQEEEQRAAEKRIVEEANCLKCAKSLFIRWFRCAPVVAGGSLYIGRDSEKRPAHELKYVTEIRQEGFCVRGTCPRCGEDCWSKFCRSLADVGRQIEPGSFIPDFGSHTCSPSEPLDTRQEEPLSSAVHLALEQYIEVLVQTKVEAINSGSCQCRPV